jgi:hypothetical protein
MVRSQALTHPTSKPLPVLTANRMSLAPVKVTAVLAATNNVLL